MKKWFRILLCGALLGASACERDNPTFGPIPRIVSGITAEYDEGSLPDPAAADRIYRRLCAPFGALRGREVPFAVETDGYEVTEVVFRTLRRTCDLTARVAVKPAERLTGRETHRLYFLAVDRDGKAFDRGIVIIAPACDSIHWVGEATFHLLPNAAPYGAFARMVFVSHDRFRAASDEMNGFR